MARSIDGHALGKRPTAGYPEAADVTRGKPDPEVYQTAAARLGVAVGNCLVAEDVLPGLAAGGAAGRALLGIATSEDETSLRAAGAQWVAPDFENLPADLRTRLGCGIS